MPSFGAATFWMNQPAPVAPLRLRGIPMLLAALAFIAGILAARHWHTSGSLALTVAALLGLFALSLRRAPHLGWPVVLTLWMAVGCWCAEVQTPIDRQAAIHTYADGLSRTIRGRVVAVRSLRDAKPVLSAPFSPVEPWQAEPGAWEDEGQLIQSVDLELLSIENLTPDTSTMQPVTGGLRLTVSGGVVPLRCGEIVDAPVRLREPEIYRDPGAFSYNDWLLGQGVGALGTARVSKVHILQQGTPGLRCHLGELQHAAAQHLEALPTTPPIRSLPAPIRLTADDTGMLAAMLFGDRTALTAAQRAGFERTGTFHLFVVSGLHVAMLTGALFWLLRKLRLPEIPAVGLTIVLALAYALLTGFGVPAQRALAMSSLYLIAHALDRQRSGLNALGTAVLLILIADPRALYEASFQMTALVILAVAGIATPLNERFLSSWQATLARLDSVELDPLLPPRIAARRVRLRPWCTLLADLTGRQWTSRLLPLLGSFALLAAQTVLVSAAIELCMALPMAIYFHRMTPLALPGNLFVAPLALSLAGSAVVTFVAGLVSPWLALLPSILTAALLHLVRHVIDALGHASLGDLRVPAPPALALVAAAALLALSIAALRARHPALATAGLAAALALPVLVLWPAAPVVHAGALEVTAIDVGQGDSVFVVSPTGQTMLIDAGGPVGRLKTKWDVGEQVVAPYLWSRHLRRLDIVVISHGHSDHIGGMPAVLRDLRPRELWLSLQPGQSTAVRDLIAEATHLGVRIRWLAAGDALDWGGMHTSVLSPQRTYANYGDARNDDSLVLRLDWHKASILLEGDAEAPSEAAMVASGLLHPVTVLKVGHHGSRTSTNPEFLAAIAPRAALISVGQHNTFGHPRWEVLDRLEAAHVRTYRTDRDGAETLLLSPEGTVTAQSAYN